MGLILKLVLGIVFGILIGLYMPEWFTQLLLTFKGLFGELLFHNSSADFILYHQWHCRLTTKLWQTA